MENGGEESLQERVEESHWDVMLRNGFHSIK